MNKRFLLFILMANSCSAAADETAEFFRVAEQLRATREVADVLAGAARRSADNRAMMRDVVRSGIMELGLSSRDEDAPSERCAMKCSIEKCSKNNDMKVNITALATRGYYDSWLQSDSFTVSTIDLELHEKGVVMAKLKGIVPFDAFQRFIDRTTSFGGSDPENVVAG